MANSGAIDKAIEVLRSQKTPKYAEVARKFNLSRHTLMRRFKGETLPRADAVSLHLKALTTVQERELITHLNRLSDRGIPPTVQITENIVFEILKRRVGHNWVYRFCHRYPDELKSVYLRAIDNSRQVADNSEFFAHYFTNVCHLLDLMTLPYC
jgi:transcriptional regulator with XRE-family HTH domain